MSHLITWLIDITLLLIFLRHYIHVFIGIVSISHQPAAVAEKSADETGSRAVAKPCKCAFLICPSPALKTQNRARPRHRGGFLISRNDPASKICILFWCVFLSRLSIVFQFLSHLVGCCPAKQIGASVQLLSSYTRDEDIANRRTTTGTYFDILIYTWYLDTLILLLFFGSFWTAFLKVVGWVLHLTPGLLTSTRHRCFYAPSLLC